nr:chromosome transmission fidelity protein 18 homolog isoform X1 [Coffea arabica]XP_027118989.1 chromosome transmission fidelity protein 18 homolog isoform X1 [Coffea arabica]XP_027118991.1 chromosome transmission fidelity protein 18 homolog isoform X1 [Coffea arabica]XP_027118992.1 chromosome transmission fidelity protein 18 homolog isoform X1 [Coffea arabica]
MDMDFPDLQELEWLEANNSNFQDDVDFDLDFPPEPPSPPSELEPPRDSPEPKIPSFKPTLSLPPKPSPIKTQTNLKKRFRPDLSPDLIDRGDGRPTGDPEEKRSRVDNGDDEEDEDWLRYPPPRPVAGNVDAGVAMSESEKVEERVLSRYATEIDGDYVPITGLDGERVYAKICGVECEDRVKKLDMRGDLNGLSREPIRVLMQRVEQGEFSKALQASVEVENDVNLSPAPVDPEQLWVDKYAPNTFMELLSDEYTNREVLLWLKQWDSSVFGSEIKSTADDTLSALKRHSSAVKHLKFHARNSFGSNRETKLSKENFRTHNYQNQEKNQSNDIQEMWEKKQKTVGHPKQKILLLCGPPGLGKTTLAHVAARHCGYRVVEINASDDRSASTIETKILDVVQMNSVVSDSKPKCLIIDEIDGALGEGKGAVDVILKMVSAERKSDSGKEIRGQEEHSGPRSSKKQKNTSLLRPVICICNDLYAPVLRPLRQVAKVQLFVQPTVNRVVNRLKYICNKEGVKTNSISLTALAEYTECDIRSCLNTLQFLNKKKEALNMLEISSQVVGRKDASKSALDIWKEVFQKRRVKRERQCMNILNNMSNELEFLLSLISNRGDYDLIYDGIHENILRLHYYDPVMQKTVQCLDNLEVSDIINKYVMRTQQMSLQVYQPQVAMIIHGLIAQVDRLNIEWPKSFQRYRTVSLEKMDILRSWHIKISPHISRHLSTKSFAEELISPFLHILSPPTLKPVALHLQSEKEKTDLAQLVNTMVSYALNYKNLQSGPLFGGPRHEDVLEGSLLSFDPPIEDFIKFKGYSSCHFVLASAVKQLLVHEVEKHKILQGCTTRCLDPLDASNQENCSLAGKENLSSQSTRSCMGIATVKKQTSAKNISLQVQNGLSMVQPLTKEASTLETASGKVRLPEKTRKLLSSSNFFDRFRKVKSDGSENVNQNVEASGTAERDLRPLLFKFNEGFTNAVKRPVRIRDFFL